MLSNTNFFHATKTFFLFSIKERKSNFCTNLYHDLKKRNEKNKLKNLEKKLKRKQNIFVRLERKNWKTKRNKQTLKKKNYTQRKIFHNMLYEHKICMQNAAFLMCLIEACNTKKISVTPLFRYRGPFIYDVTRFSPRFLKPSHSPLRNCFQLFLNFWPLLLGPLGGPIKIVS